MRDGPEAALEGGSDKAGVGLITFLRLRSSVFGYPSSNLTMLWLSNWSPPDRLKLLTMKLRLPVCSLHSEASNIANFQIENIGY